MNKVCAFIPARGGSKRIPHKNINTVLGKPMVLFSVEAAKQSGLFAEVIVSTDDPEIKKICEPHCTVLERDPALASDTATLKDVCIDFLQNYGNQFDAICLMEADCPLRDGDDLKASFAQFEKEGKPLMSVFKYGMYHPYWALSEQDEGFKPYFPAEYINKKSQEFPPLYCPSGAFKWLSKQTVLEKKTLYPDNLQVFVLPWHKAIDIDTFDDLQLAKMAKQFKEDHPDFYDEDLRHTSER